MLKACYTYNEQAARKGAASGPPPALEPPVRVEPFVVHGVIEGVNAYTVGLMFIAYEHGEPVPTVEHMREWFDLRNHPDGTSTARRIESVEAMMMADLS